MAKNRIFASMMMTLSPISLILALYIINPNDVSDYFLVFSICGLVWFSLHSLILLIAVLMYRNKSVIDKIG
ncbi:hypothetical protein [Chryseobacterium terrae]|uniref:Uncharacterized protein n=1 Tax=Chryseobacterium terrae TaxID=3163299 RepID=A0ABW8Y993_9FLAO